MVTWIPNGYAAEDFAAPEPPAADGLFRIVHTGYLHTGQGLRLRRQRISRALGGAHPGLDILPRSHAFLFDALDALAARDPAVAEDVEVVLAGVLSPTDEALCRGRAVPIRAPGYLDHLRSVELMRSADLLFLPMHALPPGTRASIVPGKTYEYLASGRPILAAVPEGDARDLLAGSGRAELCAPSDTAAIAAGVERALDRFRRAGRTPTRPIEDVAEYERKRLSARMASVFDGLAAPAAPVEAPPA
jgi:glycosyltransferase involved in cell wall biosynthesis